MMIRKERNRECRGLSITICCCFIVVLLLTACGQDLKTITVDIKSFPEYPSQQVDLYMAKCGACHGAPLPSTRLAKIWPSILYRMQMRMVNKKVVPLSADEMSQILDYLQRNAE